MYNVLIILIAIASILMTLIVLIQESKGGGLASGFSSSNQIMGIRKTTDVIEKTTWGLAIAMVVLSVACAYAVPTMTKDSSVILKQNALPAVPAAAPTATQQPAATMPTTTEPAAEGNTAEPAAAAPEAN